MWPNMNTVSQCSVSTVCGICAVSCRIFSGKVPPLFLVSWRVTDTTVGFVFDKCDGSKLKT